MRNWVVQESIIWKAQAQARFWLRVEAQSFENSGLVIFCSKGQTLFCQCRKLLLATKKRYLQEGPSYRNSVFTQVS